jgi:hypothetical protein
MVKAGVYLDLVLGVQAVEGLRELHLGPVRLNPPAGSRRIGRR